jgi:hypothetical protein
MEGLRNPVANNVSDRPTLGSNFGIHNRAVGRVCGHCGEGACSRSAAQAP